MALPFFFFNFSTFISFKVDIFIYLCDFIDYLKVYHSFFHCLVSLLYCLGYVESLYWINRADSAAVAITTTDLVSKSVAIESEVHGTIMLYLVSCNSSIFHSLSLSLCEYMFQKISIWCQDLYELSCCLSHYCLRYFCAYLLMDFFPSFAH